MEYTFSDRISTLKPSAIREIFKYAADKAAKFPYGHIALLMPVGIVYAL